MASKQFQLSGLEEYFKRCAQSAIFRPLMSGIAFWIALWIVGVTAFDHSFLESTLHQTSKGKVLTYVGHSSQLHGFNGERQVSKYEKRLPASRNTQDFPATILAAGDIAKCDGEDPWKDKFLKLVKILPDDSPHEPFLENLLELLSLSEETDYPANAALTANLVLRLPGRVLALGDLVYPTGSTQQFRECYESTWGQFKKRTYPVPGNHEYKHKNAQPYFDYWGTQAGQIGKGYYSFDAGEWHIIALNSKIEKAKHERSISAQHRWLQNDLAETNARCILAYWHHPVFSSGQHSGTARMMNILRTLYKFGLTVILTGHAHHYERFAPQNPEGVRDLIRGFRQFVVGTGGVPLRSLKKRHRNSENFQADSFGVLRLDLHPNHYLWEFLSVDKVQPYDKGEGKCITPPKLKTLQQRT